MADPIFQQPVIFSQTPNEDSTFPNARGIGVGEGLQIADGGPNNNVIISPAKLLQTIEALVPGGIIAKDSLDNAYVRSIQGGTGIAVANGDGIAGNPNISAIPGTTKQLTQVMFNDANVGAPRGNINFIPGSGVGMYINDDGTNINVNISASDGGGGGPGGEVNTNLIEAVTDGASTQLWPNAGSIAVAQPGMNTSFLGATTFNGAATFDDSVSLTPGNELDASVIHCTQINNRTVDGNGIVIFNSDGTGNISIGSQSPGRLVLGSGPSANVDISYQAALDSSTTIGSQSQGLIEIGHDTTGDILIGENASGDVVIGLQTAGQILIGETSSGPIQIGLHTTGIVGIASFGSDNISLGAAASGEIQIGGDGPGNIQIGPATTGVINIGNTASGLIDIGNTASGGIYLGTNSSGDGTFINHASFAPVTIGSGGGPVTIGAGTSTTTFPGNVTVEGTLTSPRNISQFVVSYAAALTGGGAFVPVNGTVSDASLSGWTDGTGGIIICSTPGRYQVIYNIWASGPTGTSYNLKAALYSNGSILPHQGNGVAAAVFSTTSEIPYASMCSTLINDFVASDTLQLYIYLDLGVIQTVNLVISCNIVKID